MMVAQGNVVGRYPRPCTGDSRKHITSVVVYLGLLEAVHGGNRIASNYSREDRRMSVLHGASLLSHVQGRTLLAKNQPREFFAKRDSLTDRGLLHFVRRKLGEVGHEVVGHLQGVRHFAWSSPTCCFAEILLPFCLSFININLCV